MSELKKEVLVKTFKSNYYCDECFDEEIKYTGEMLMSYPPLYVHQCPKCKKRYNLRKNYPVIENEYVEID